MEINQRVRGDENYIHKKTERKSSIQKKSKTEGKMD